MMWDRAVTRCYLMRSSRGRIKLLQVLLVPLLAEAVLTTVLLISWVGAGQSLPLPCGESTRLMMKTAMGTNVMLWYNCYMGLAADAVAVWHLRLLGHNTDQSDGEH
jgi:hypothetical protein